MSATSNLPVSLDLQRHLYNSFLAQQTSDVTLRVRGSWSAVYRLHRVVLIQAEFFKSLFTAGFAESKARSSHQSGKSEWLNIHFDDPNITRAAFEICIARLYGGGPQLFISPTLKPTPTHPLTPIAPFYDPNDINSPPPPTNLQDVCPPGSHPASPRFLLSLLATSAFLSIPLVATQALTAILHTVGPRTVMRYINFALGQGIGEPDPEYDWDEPVAAVGLESVAELIEEEGEGVLGDLGDYHVLSSHTKEEQLGGKFEETHLDDTMKQCGSPAAPSFPDHIHPDTSSTPAVEYNYGGLSDKVGEAAMCWLTRWGADVYRFEQDEMNGNPEPMTEQQQQPYAHLLSSVTSPVTRKRAATIPSSSPAGIATSSKPLFHIEAAVPRIWRRGGLTAPWVRQILSSDSLFVLGEKERYDLCRSVVDLRRREGIDPAEEAEWDILFQRGIYYSTMTLDQAMVVLQDVSQTTGKPYVPLQVVQAAHWESSLLQHSITYRPGTSSSPTKARGKELEIALHTPDLLATPSNLFSSRDKRYFPVPGDSSTRIGDSTGLEGASMDQLFDSGSRILTGGGSGTLNQHNSQSNGFGLEQRAYFPAECLQVDPHGKTRWSPYPPLRFGVEFWDVDSLKEKSRLHSHTVWYAGSLWNVYVQVVRKKNVQLGVYLHRQSSVDPIPPASAPLIFPMRTLSNVRSMQHMSSSSDSHVSMPSRSSTPHGGAASPTTSSPGRPSSLPSSYSASSIGSSKPMVTTVPATCSSTYPQPTVPRS
ncbi:hypothetical protein QCA50_008364 [Cerrena zonata]|uniref:BTB domain-containing protein n=1 Tax=Cerrena zonata TaxID=2478898 RepID=A0AAW0G9G0_9APHY